MARKNNILAKPTNAPPIPPKPSAAITTPTTRKIRAHFSIAVSFGWTDAETSGQVRGSCGVEEDEATTTMTFLFPSFPRRREPITSELQEVRASEYIGSRFRGNDG
jgi:hypothetical protein